MRYPAYVHESNYIYLKPCSDNTFRRLHKCNLSSLRNRRLMVRAHSSALSAARTYVKFTFDVSRLSEIDSPLSGCFTSRPVCSGCNLFPETRPCIITSQNRSIANPVKHGTSRLTDARSVSGRIVTPLFNAITKSWRHFPMSDSVVLTGQRVE